MRHSRTQPDAIRNNALRRTDHQALHGPGPLTIVELQARVRFWSRYGRFAVPDKTAAASVRYVRKG